MNLTQARDLAKEAWRHPRNAKEPIYPNLLESFAEILEREVNAAVLQKVGTPEQVPMVCNTPAEDAMGVGPVFRF